MKKFGTFLLLLLSVAIFRLAYSQTTCPVPDGLQATSVGAKSVTLTWNGTSDSLFILKYKIDDPNINYNWRYRKIDKNVNTFTLAPLRSNTSYIAQIRAYCGKSDKSEYSDPVKFKTTECKTVTDLSVVDVTSHSAKLAWKGNDGDAFIVRYKKTVGGVFHYRRTTQNYIIINNLQGSSIYEWCVEAVCKNGNDAKLPYVCGPSFVTQGCKPPSLVIVNDITYHTASIYWDINSDASMYILKFQIVGDDKSVKYRKTEGNNLTITQLKPDSKYMVQVGVFCPKLSEGNDTLIKIYGSPVYFTTKISPVCPAPVELVTIGVTGSSAKLSWKTCPQAKKYMIRYRIDGSKRFHYSMLNANDVPFLLKNLHPSLKYFWRVKTYYLLEDGLLHQTAYSDSATFVTAKPAKLLSADNTLNVQVYPNPSQGRFTLSVYNDRPFDFEIYNMIGKLAYSETGKPANYVEEISIPELTSGVYFLKVYNGIETKTIKLVIE